MSTIGEDLKHQRELKHWSIEEVAKATKISVRYLKALEDNRYEILPGQAYGKAYMRIYAAYLGLDPEDMLRRYISLTAPRPSEQPVITVSAPAEDRPLHPFFTIAGLALLAMMGLFLFLKQNKPQWARVLDRAGSDAIAEAQPRKTAEVLRSPPVATSSPSGHASPAAISSTGAPDAEPDQPATRTAGNQASAPIPPNNAAEPVSATGATESASLITSMALGREEATGSATDVSRGYSVMNLEVLANSKCWVEAYTDQARAIGRVIDMGQKLDLQAHNKFLLTLGSAGAVDLRLNGHSMKRIGKLGEVKKITITADNYRDFLE